MWLFGFIYMVITFYKTSGSLDVLYFSPIIILYAVVNYVPMKIAFDDTKIIVSDWLSKTEYKFEDIKSMKYSKSSIPFIPYSLLEMTMTDDSLKKIKFLPRASDSFKSLFSMKLKGSQRELLDLWRVHTDASKR